MDELTKIQLGENQNVDSVNQDTTIKINLSAKKSILMEYDARSIVDVTELFNEERREVQTYRIQGEIEYLSLLNSLITGYTQISEFFQRNPTTAITKTILTDFEFYLLKPLPPSGTTLADGVTVSSGYTVLSADTQYIKDYEVIAIPSEIDILRAGFAKNIFGEQQYSFIVNIDIDLEDVYDGLNFPITDLYLYALYQPTVGKSETISRKVYNSTGGTSASTLTFVPTTLSRGDVVIGDVISYNKKRFLQTTTNTMEYYINTPVSDTPNNLRWKYSPIIPISIRTLSEDLSRVNISGTSILDIESKPDYATKIDDDGNYVWRTLLDIGFVDPLTEVGVNHPFINKKHYVFTTIVMPVTPDLDDTNTAGVFEDISFADNTFIYSQPNSNLNNIGKIC